MAAAEGAVRMVALRSQEGVDFVVPAEEARLSLFIHRRLLLYPDKHIVPDPADGKSITTHVLSKVLHYCKHYYQYHASSCSSSGWEWDAAHELNHNETLYDLIMASDNLQLLPLLDLTCHTLANKIKGMSPGEICNILNIKGVFTPELKINDEDHSTASCTFNMVTSAMDVISNNKTCVTQELKLRQKALDALDILCCQEFTAYDPKRNHRKLNRINMYNLAFFDIYKESSFSRGPPLHKIPPTCESVVRSCVNVISVKVCESDVGFPINVFGTIIARDQVDYRCVYLFRRGMDNPQFISSSDDMLSLMDPCRALVPGDSLF